MFAAFAKSGKPISGDAGWEGELCCYIQNPDQIGGALARGPLGENIPKQGEISENTMEVIASARFGLSVSGAKERATA